MMVCAVMCVIAAGAPSFAVHAVPIENAEAEVLVADIDADAVPELVVIDHQTVRIFAAAQLDPVRILRLPEGTSAIDLFDVTGDGRADLLALQRERLLLFDTAADAGAEPRTLFRMETPLAETRTQPFPYTMALSWEGAVVIALPRKGRIDLRTLQGEPVAAFPSLANDAAGIDYGHPFRVRAIDPPQAGSEHALELRVSMVRDTAPVLPEGVPAETPANAGRPGTLSHAREASAGVFASWPWFPLRRGAPDSGRVFYALEPPEFRDTLVRVEGGPPAEDGAADVQTFRYPGSLVSYGDVDLPDFNGDGFVDLFLWKAPLPGSSVDVLARAVTGGAWPLTTTVHLFDARTGKYAARPSAAVRHQVAVAWYVTTDQGSPLRNLVFQDFNGDGRTDLGCSADPRTFAAWLFNDGFRQKPDFQHAFDDAVGDLEIVSATAGSAAVLVFRTPSALNVVHVQPAP